MDNQPQPVQVEQVDREVAAVLYGQTIQYPTLVCTMIRCGEADDGPSVQAFARHRLAAQAGLEEMREALRAIQVLKRSIMIDVGSCHSMRGPGASSEMRADDWEMRADIEAAFTKIDAALAPPPVETSEIGAEEECHSCDEYEQELKRAEHVIETLNRKILAGGQAEYRRAIEDAAKVAETWDGAKVSASKLRVVLATAIRNLTPPEAVSAPVVGEVERWRPEVMAFADLMEAQLRANDHKPGWKSDSPSALLCRAYDELSELTDRLDVDCDPSLIGNEAADVANFAMMIADVSGALTPQPDGWTEKGKQWLADGCPPVSTPAPDSGETHHGE